MEKLIKLALPAGIHSNGTAYQNAGKWIAGHLVRWHEGAIRPVGGWSVVRDQGGGDIDAVGFPRGAHSWRANDGDAWLGLGTTGSDSRLYGLANGVLTDITPAGLVDGEADGQVFSGTGNYGEGNYGDGLYGGGSHAGVLVDADTWTLDNFGELLLACLTSDGKLYSWDLNTSNDASQITNSPESCTGLVVTPERFLFALGADGDPRNVEWASRETLTTWTAAAGNSAGGFVLQTNGRLVTGERTAKETLLWTDADLWGAVFIGGPFVYSFQQRGDSCGIIGPNAVTIAEGAAYWMGKGQFFVYDGAVRSIPCSVTDHVFGDLNTDQRAKIAAVPIEQFGEVWWFYPSASQSGLENDRYVAVNYRQGFWMTGELDRAIGVGAGVFTNPVMADASGALYLHEEGQDRGGETPYIESGPLELGDGDRVVRVQKVVADEASSGDVEAIFYSSFAPMDAETEHGPFSLSARTDVRFSGRQFRMRLEEIGDVVLADGSEEADGELVAGPVPGADFRIGTFRVGVIPGGMR